MKRKTLAAQVRAYMAWRREAGEKFDDAEMAAEVARHQASDAKRCKRQNIESLLRLDSKTVLYLPALAQAMGTTAEILDSGLYAPPSGEATPPAMDVKTATPISDALSTLDQAVKLASGRTRADLQKLFDLYLGDPAQHGDLLPKIRALLSGEIRSPVSRPRRTGTTGM